MVSIRHGSALAESFLSSHHLYHLPLYVPKLAPLRLAWRSPLWRSRVLAGEGKSWHPLPGTAIPPSASFRVPRVPQFIFFFFPDMFPEARPFNGTAEPSRFLSFGLSVRTDLELRWEGGAVDALQDPQVFPVSAAVPGRMGAGGGEGGWGAEEVEGQEERVESRQWDSGITLL